MSANPMNPFPTQSISNAQTPDDRTWLDRIGITASVACAIHCMIAPLLLLLLPAAGSIWSDPQVHWGLAVLVLPLAVWVIYRGYCKHGKRLTLAAAVSGSACIVAGLIAPIFSTQPLFSLPMPSWSTLGQATVQTSAPLPSGSLALFAEDINMPTPAAESTEPSTCTDGCCDIKAKENAEGALAILGPEATAGLAPAAYAGACCGTRETVPTARGQTLGCTEACCDLDNTEQAPAESVQTTEAASSKDIPLSCTAACCPSLTVSEYAGAVTMGFPAGGVFTMIGSFLLVLAHATNLHACRCFSQVSDAASDCGCPTQF